MKNFELLTKELLAEYSASELHESINFAKYAILANAEIITQVDKEQLSRLDKLSLFLTKCNGVELENAAISDQVDQARQGS